VYPPIFKQHKNWTRFTNTIVWFFLFSFQSILGFSLFRFPSAVTFSVRSERRIKLPEKTKSRKFVFDVIFKFSFFRSSDGTPYSDDTTFCRVDLIWYYPM
jgi:hypothetical protein